MNNMPNAKDCISYIEKDLGIHLYDFQKKLIVAWFGGYTVATCRGVGRSFCKNLVRAYLNLWADSLDQCGDSLKNVDLKIPLEEVWKEVRFFSDSFIDDMRNNHPDVFEKEFTLTKMGDSD